MTTYADSSALVPLYVAEQFSAAAEAAVRRAGQVPFTAIHRLEVANAFERLVGRRLITRAQCRAVQRHLQDDLDGRRLLPIAVDLSQVFEIAGELSARHAARHLARSLDLLHVAAALAAGCTTLVSADDRQLAVAKAARLVVVDIKRPARRQRR